MLDELTLRLLKNMFSRVNTHKLNGFSVELEGSATHFISDSGNRRNVQYDVQRESIAKSSVKINRIHRSKIIRKF